MPALLSPSAADHAGDPLDPLDPFAQQVEDAWQLAAYLADKLAEDGVDYVEALALVAQHLADRLDAIRGALPGPQDASPRRRRRRPNA